MAPSPVCSKLAQRYQHLMLFLHELVNISIRFTDSRHSESKPTSDKRDKGQEKKKPERMLGRRLQELLVVIVRNPDNSQLYVTPVLLVQLVGGQTK